MNLFFPDQDAEVQFPQQPYHHKAHANADDKLERDV